MIDTNSNTIGCSKQELSSVIRPCLADPEWAEKARPANIFLSVSDSYAARDEQWSFYDLCRFLSAPCKDYNALESYRRSWAPTEDIERATGSVKHEAREAATLARFNDQVLPKYHVTDKKALPSVVFAQLLDGHRKKEKCEAVYYLVFDYDNKGERLVDIHEAVEFWASRGIACVAYTSFSSTREHPCFRLLVPLSCSVTIAEHAALHARIEPLLLAYHDAGEKVIDLTASRNPVQLWFLPGFDDYERFNAYNARSDDFQSGTYPDLPHGVAPLDINFLLSFPIPLAQLPQLPDDPRGKAPSLPRTALGDLGQGEYTFEEKRRLASAYLAKIDPQANGHDGNALLYELACLCCWGFDLGYAEGVDLIASEFNPRRAGGSALLWKLKDIQEACRNAVRKAQGERGAKLPSKQFLSLNPLSRLSVPDDSAAPGALNAHNFLERLNETYGVITVGGKLRILHKTEDGFELLSKTDFIDSLAPIRIERQIPDKKGKNKTVMSSVASLWFNDIGRRTYTKIVFDPSNTAPPEHYNTYSGLAIEPQKGSCELFKKHTLEVICSNNKIHYDYLWSWLADMVQHPSKRPGVAVGLKSEAEGTGKGLFVQFLLSIFGQHGKQLGNGDHIVGKFNAALKDLVLCVADEACWAGSHRAADSLKGLITEPVMQLEMKGVDPIDIANHIHFVFTSNKSYFVPSGKHDRRYFVLEVSPHRVGDRSYFDALLSELHCGGPAALLSELLEFDLGGVNLREVPQTRELLTQKLEGASSLDRWWLMELETCDLWDDGKTQVNCNDLYLRYVAFAKDGGDRRPIDNRALGVALKELFGGSVESGRHSNGERHRYYKLPPLLHCRLVFEKRFKASFDWPKSIDERAQNSQPPLIN